MVKRIQAINAEWQKGGEGFCMEFKNDEDIENLPEGSFTCMMSPLKRIHDKTLHFKLCEEFIKHIWNKADSND